MPANQSYKGGQLRKAMGQKVKVYPSGVVAGIVGARDSFRIEVGARVRKGPKTAKSPCKIGDPIFINPTKYLHLVELGTRRGVPGKHFLRDSMQSAEGEITSQMISIIDEAIATAWSGRGDE